MPAFVQSILTGRAARSDAEPLAEPRPVSAAVMPAGPIVWRDDGRPDWGSTWTSFCDLALFGGPPHRPATEPVTVTSESPDACAPRASESAAMREIRRGVWETTGLFSEPATPGWLAISCHTPRMAEWLCRAIGLENVEARCDGRRLLVPACTSFTLEREVKSVITVVAKTTHYWDQHGA